jgi:hypothetical protein
VSRAGSSVVQIVSTPKALFHGGADALRYLYERQ